MLFLVSMTRWGRIEIFIYRAGLNIKITTPGDARQYFRIRRIFYV